MPLPAKDLWIKIQKELHGKTEREQLRTLHRYLDTWHDSWKGPYWDLKERLRRLVNKLEHTESMRSRGQPDASHVKRQGDAQVALVGPVNTGKSALLYALTGAAATVADYPFSTQYPMPGMLACEGGSLQIVDTPAVVAGLSKGEGAGRSLLHLLGTMDALCVVVDLSRPPTPQFELVRDELASVRMRLRPEPISTELHVKGKGGIKFRGREIPKAEQTLVRCLLSTADISHAEVIVYREFNEAELQAQIEQIRLMPTIIVASKNDMLGADDRLDKLRRSYPRYRIVDVNFLSEEHFDLLAETIWEQLGFVRVVLLEKPRPDGTASPTLVRRASSIAEIAEDAGLPRDGEPRCAQVWGTSVTLPGQIVSLQHRIEAGDRIYIQH